MTEERDEALQLWAKAGGGEVPQWHWVLPIVERLVHLARAQSSEELAEARERAHREEVGVLKDVLYRNGIVPCDISACNCGGWHAMYGVKQRFDEICDALREADVLNNDVFNLPLNAIAKLVAQRDQNTELSRTACLAATEEQDKRIAAERKCRELEADAARWRQLAKCKLFDEATLTAEIDAVIAALASQARKGQG